MPSLLQSKDDAKTYGRGCWITVGACGGKVGALVGNEVPGSGVGALKWILYVEGRKVSQDAKVKFQLIQEG
jgi:hypothetical protein